MGRDKAKDYRYFNCSEEHELKYIADLYDNKLKIYDFIVMKCISGEIKNSTHMEVYQLIKKELGYPIPV